MKKYLLFYLVISFNTLLAQSIDNQIDSITNKFAYNLAHQIMITYQKDFFIYQKVGINVDVLYNDKGTKTILSQKLSIYIAQHLNKWLNKCNLCPTKFDVNSPFDVSNIYKRLENVSNYDFTITGSYILDKSKSQLSFVNLKIIPNKNQNLATYTFETFKVDIRNIENYFKLDVVDNSTSVFQEFIDLNKENVFISKVDMLQGTNKVEMIEYGTKKVLLAKYDTEYNFFVKINKSAYVYVFFFDPNDVKYPYLWYIDEENKLIEPGNYNNFLKENIAFFRSNDTKSISYLKIIATNQKLEIDNYLTKKIIDGYESLVIESTQCRKLIDDLMKIGELQSINLLITFKD